MTRVKHQIRETYGDHAQKVLRDMSQNFVNESPPTPTDWAHSSVSTFRVRYAPPLPDLSISQSLEALVEGSDMSLLREGEPHLTATEILGNSLYRLRECYDSGICVGTP